MAEDYKLVWEDNFSDGRLSMADWEFETHEVGWIPNELQEYVASSDCAFIKDNKLVIQPVRVINGDATVGYKSARLSTKSTHAFKYGRFEVRVKVPKGDGLLPAFRLLPVDESVYGGWPACGEIDVMEVVRHVPQRTYGTINYGMPHSSGRFSASVDSGELSDDYHVYGCEWEPGEIRFLLDGEVYARENYWISRSADGKVTHPYPAPFNKEFFIILTVSVGGDWAGEPDISTFFEDRAQMMVDWVRVYQRPEYDENVTLQMREVKLRDADITGNLLLSSSDDWDLINYNSGRGKFIHAEDGSMVITTENEGYTDYAIQLIQNMVPLVKGQEYILSFEAKSSAERRMNVAITNPRLDFKRHLKDTVISLDTDWQTHRVYFVMDDDTNGAARLEFNCGNMGSVAQIMLRNIRLDKTSSKTNKRKVLAVCGVWEDADNFNSFVKALQIPQITDKYVISAMTFGIESKGLTPEKINLEFADILKRFDLGGIIIFSEMIKSQPLINRLISIGNEYNVPVFTLERPQKDCINILLDYKDGFRKVAKHMIQEHGYTDVMMFAGVKGNSFSDDREDVFRELLAENGIECNENSVLYGEFWDANATKELTRYVKVGGRIPRAIICANDSMAIGVIDCLIAHGMRVPEDVAVSGFDGTWVSYCHDPAITTCAPDYKAVTDFITETLASGSTAARDVVVGFTLNPDVSCGCPSRAKPQTSITSLCHNNQDFFRHGLEMGRFVAKTISMTNMDEAMENLTEYLWLWPDQYYFAALFIEDGIHGLIRGDMGKYNFKQKFYRYPGLFPDMDDILQVGGPINVMLFRHINSTVQSQGYICNAYNYMDLREEQRFEEFGQYFTTVVNAVYNNRQLLKVNSDIESMSQKDYLTGLFNRRGFLSKLDDMINDAENAGRVLSVFSIDMNGLKYINDNFGHQDGDTAIRILAKSLKAFVGSRGICARYGGDEFAVAIVGDYELLPEYQDIHNRICEYSSAEAEVLGKPYPVTASIGISEKRIRPNLNIEDMMGAADTAMYIDKQAHRGRYSRL